jgi:hypothetical protein
MPDILPLPRFFSWSWVDSSGMKEAVRFSLVRSCDGGQRHSIVGVGEISYFEKWTADETTFVVEHPSRLKVL